MPSGLAALANNKAFSNQMTEFLKNRFGKDTRYKEAEFMLSSMHPMTIKIDALDTNHSVWSAISENERQRQIKL